MHKVGWTRELPDTKPGHYFVTCRNQRGQTAFLYGPYTQDRHGPQAHTRALNKVFHARKTVGRVARRDAPWLTYGTCRLPLGARLPMAKLGKS